MFRIQILVWWWVLFSGHVKENVFVLRNHSCRISDRLLLAQIFRVSLWQIRPSLAQNHQLYQVCHRAGGASQNLVSVWCGKLSKKKLTKVTLKAHWMSDSFPVSKSWNMKKLWTKKINWTWAKLRLVDGKLFLNFASSQLSDAFTDFNVNKVNLKCDKSLRKRAEYLFDGWKNDLSLSNQGPKFKMIFFRENKRYFKASNEIFW